MLPKRAMKSAFAEDVEKVRIVVDPDGRNTPPGKFRTVIFEKFQSSRSQSLSLPREVRVQSFIVVHPSH
jgi:chaperone required for assembly of F1-ATPase